LEESVAYIVKAGQSKLQPEDLILQVNVGLTASTLKSTISYGFRTTSNKTGVLKATLRF